NRTHGGVAHVLSVQRPRPRPRPFSYPGSSRADGINPEALLASPFVADGADPRPKVRERVDEPRGVDEPRAPDKAASGAPGPSRDGGRLDRSRQPCSEQALPASPSHAEQPGSTEEHRDGFGDRSIHAIRVALRVTLQGPVDPSRAAPAKLDVDV